MRTIEITNQQYEILENLRRQEKISLRQALDKLLKQRMQAEKSRAALLQINPKAKPLTKADEKLIDDAVHESRTFKG